MGGYHSQSVEDSGNFDSSCARNVIHTPWYQEDGESDYLHVEDAPEYDITNRFGEMIHDKKDNELQPWTSIYYKKMGATTAQRTVR